MTVLQDPRGPDKGRYHIFRGASWNNAPRTWEHIGGGRRSWRLGGDHYPTVGLRLVCRERAYGEKQP